MNKKVSSYEEQLQSTRFQLAVIRLEAALSSISANANRNHQFVLMKSFRLIQSYSNQAEITILSEGVDKLIKNVNKIRMKILRKSFFQMIYYQPKEIEELRNIELAKQKQEIDLKVRELKSKIKNIEQAYSQFCQVILQLN